MPMPAINTKKLSSVNGDDDSYDYSINHDYSINLDDDDSHLSSTTAGVSVATPSSGNRSEKFTKSDEERTVKGARCLFLFVLLLAAGVLCGVVYWVTKAGENEDFHAEVRPKSMGKFRFSSLALSIMAHISVPPISNRSSKTMD